jgi:predicted dehydrogenase
MEALLESPDIDAVLNLTPPKHHVPVSLASLRAGKHVLTEKLMANSLEEADELIDEAARRRRIFVCAPAVVTSPFLVDIRHALHGGAVGRVMGARAQLSTFGPAAWAEYTSDPTWFYDEGAGPLADLGVYPLHMLTELLGPVRRITALSGISLPTRSVLVGPFAGKEIEVHVDDNVQMLLAFPDDNGPATFANLASTYCAWQSPSPTLEVFGTEGVLVFEDLYDPRGEARIWRAHGRGAGAWEPIARIEPNAGHTRGLYIFGGVEHLVECIQRGLHPILSGEHARHVLDVVISAGRSAREGRTLELSTSFAYPKDWPEFGL